MTRVKRLIVMTAVLLAGLLSWGGNVMAYEEPSYEVVATYADFEVRQYAPYLVAETYVHGAFKDVGSQAFRRLFAYISEDERPQGKIPMTTPVIQQPATEPTGKEDARKAYRLAFVMPDNYTLETLPKPDNAEILLKEVPARKMAVRRYSGTWSEEKYRENEAILLQALKAEGLPTVGAPIFARYNAPFSLWFLRRNEVLMELGEL
jgi:hypothetical protein